jgi:hypothetical protein
LNNNKHKLSGAFYRIYIVAQDTYKYSHKHTYKAHTVSKCNIKSTKIKDILKHAEAISSKHKITKQH